MTARSTPSIHSDSGPHGGLEDTLLRETIGDEPSGPRVDDVEVLPRGATVGRYVVLGRIGSGGMGVVYAAYDPDLDRRVALKVLRAGLDDAGDSAARSRLLREGKAMARVRHPNVITVHDVGTDEGRVFIAMDFIDGETLTDWLHARARPREEILAVFAAAGEGLAAAHRQGLVHRDFKPDNVLIARDGGVCVVDFGLARRDAWAPEGAGEPSTDPPPISDEDEDENEDEDEPPPLAVPRDDGLAESITQTGMLLGTPAYMAPEQHLGLLPGAAADQFAFCVALYHALYGERPFAGASPAELLHNVMEGEVASAPASARVPGWIRRVLLRGLERKPRERWPDMESLLEALADAPEHRRRRRGGAVLGVAVVAGGLGAWAGLGAEAPTCDDGSEAWAGLWDDEAKARYAAAFRATGRAFAEPAWAAVARDGDAYVEEWGRTHEDACEATHLRHEQSPEVLALREVCLERARDRFATLTELFAEADAEVVARAVDALRALPPPRCDGQAVLRDDARLRGSTQRRAELVAEQRRLDRARVLVRAHRLESARALAEQGRARARALDDAALEAEALLVRADVEEASGHPDDARASIQQALLLAESHDLDRVAASAWLELLWVDGFRSSRYPDAHAAAEHAEALLRRWPEAHDDRWLLISRRGDLLYAQGRYEEALEHHRRALEQRDRAVASLDSRRAEALTGMGLAELELGRLDDALVHLREAEEQLRAIYGEGHPRHAAALTNLGTVHELRGELEQARERHAAALEAAEASVGPHHPSVAEILNNYAGVLVASGRLDEADAAFVRAEEIWRESYGPEHPDLAMIAYNRAVVAEERHDDRRARSLHERALGLREQGLGPEHPDVATSLVALAVLDARDGDEDGARRRLERARAIVRGRFEADAEIVQEIEARLDQLSAPPVAAP